MSAQPQLPIILRRSPLKWLGILALSAAFVAIGMWMRHELDTFDQIMAWAGIVFFGLGVVVAVFNLIPGTSYLLLDHNGFELHAMFRTLRVAWADVEGFGAVTIPNTRRLWLAWNYLPGRGKASRLRDFNRSRFGFDAALPDTYGMSASALCEMLDSLRRRHCA